MRERFDFDTVDCLSFDDLLPYGTAENGTLRFNRSFSVSRTYARTSDCLLLSVNAAYTGEKPPKVRFSLTPDGQSEPLYPSLSYTAGGAGKFAHKTWRIPPAMTDDMTFTLSFEIPEGSALLLNDLHTARDTGAPAWQGGVRHNAHLGFWGVAPENTMPAFEMAAACGFPACIVVPKVTKDGVFVCIHDDKINRHARSAEGNAPKDPVFVWDLTYKELLAFDFGLQKNEIFRATPIPLLSDFLDLCQKTGMRPMFSTHPALTRAQWLEVKDMLSSRGLLKRFHIKSFFADNLKLAYSVFGTEIEGYTLDVSSWDGTEVDTMRNIGIDTALCRVGIEVAFGKYTKEIARAIRDAGFFAAAYDVGMRDYTEYETLLSYGVSEFTEDFHCSMGLNC